MYGGENKMINGRRQSSSESLTRGYVTWVIEANNKVAPALLLLN